MTIYGWFFQGRIMSFYAAVWVIVSGNYIELILLRGTVLKLKLL
jgi:hypothetical protein